MLTDNRKKAELMNQCFNFFLLGQREEFLVRKGRIKIGKRSLSSQRRKESYPNEFILTTSQATGKRAGKTVEQQMAIHEESQSMSMCPDDDTETEFFLIFQKREEEESTHSHNFMYYKPISLMFTPCEILYGLFVSIQERKRMIINR